LVANSEVNPAALASHNNMQVGIAPRSVLVAILKKRLHLSASLYTILQILSLTLFEKMPISQALAQLPPASTSPDTDNHQCLLAF